MVAETPPHVGRAAVYIRTACPEDAPAIEQVLREAFREFHSLYTKRAFAATTPTTKQILTRLKEGPIWVAERNRTVVGTVSATQKADSLYIRGMSVLPEVRGQRVGYALLQKVEEFAAAGECRRLYLSTTPFLARAIRLYEEYGFQRSDEGPHDLFGTPLFTMEKRLAS